MEISAVNGVALQRAVDVFGSQSALAKEISVSQQNISYWLNDAAGKVPAEHCAAIERATKGRVTRQDLRPDVFGVAS